VTRVRILTTRQRLAPARHLLDEVEDELDDWRPPELAVRWLHLAAAELDLADGDAPGALRQFSVRDEETGIADQERVCQARALLQSGQPEAAEKLVAPVRELATSRGAEVEAWLVTAVAADHGREDHRATSAIQRALELAAEDGFRRPFMLFDRERMSRILTRALTLDPPGSPFANQVLAELSRDTGGGEAALVEPLTDRELMVLQVLPSMSSNAEIAEELYVSVNTVKAHLKSLYRKLEVSSRRAAVQRARQLDLFAGGAQNPFRSQD
jgi:LuxR family maltose regulon positive regulatory protein